MEDFLDVPFVAERLRLARERRGLNKSELARAIGKSPRTISSYESGLTEPTPDVLRRLADVLSFPVEFFGEPLGATVPLDSASFRSLSRMTAGQRDSALAVGSFGVALNRWIEDRFVLPSSNLPDLRPGWTDPEGAASAVRASWGLGLSPIQNMTHLLEANGVRVFSLVDECKEVDAFSFWHEATPFVCVSLFKTAERAVFDLAHELGHLILHKDHSAPRGREAEKEADRFASAFLMPEDDIRARAPRSPNLQDIVESKRRWRVSAAALSYRLWSLQLITDWHYKSLCIEISRLGRKTEPNSIPFERSQLFEKVFSAMRSEGLSRREIAADLKLHHRDLDGLTFGLSLTVLDGGGEEGGHLKRMLKLVRD